MYSKVLYMHLARLFYLSMVVSVYDLGSVEVTHVLEGVHSHDGAASTCVQLPGLQSPLQATQHCTRAATCNKNTQLQHSTVNRQQHAIKTISCNTAL